MRVFRLARYTHVLAALRLFIVAKNAKNKTGRNTR